MRTGVDQVQWWHDRGRRKSSTAPAVPARPERPPKLGGAAPPSAAAAAVAAAKTTRTSSCSTIPHACTYTSMYARESCRNLIYYRIIKDAISKSTTKEFFDRWWKPEFTNCLESVIAVRSLLGALVWRRVCDPGLRSQRRIQAQASRPSLSPLMSVQTSDLLSRLLPWSMHARPF